MIFTSHDHFWHLVNRDGYDWSTDVLIESTLDGIPLSFPYLIAARDFDGGETPSVDDDPHSDKFHWYLHQRSDLEEKQYLSIVNKTSTPTETYSGQIELDVTALADQFADSPYSTDDIWRLFDMVTVYVYRIDDGALQAFRPVKLLVGGEV